MNGLSIVRALEARGIRLELGDGGRLVVDAPKGALDPEEIERLRAAKPAIIAALLDQSPALASTACESMPDLRIPPEVADEIRRIETEAYRLGWRPERLWNRDFWPHTRDRPRGLASVLGPGDRITEIDSEHISIERRRQDCDFNRYRFWRSDA